MDKSGAGSVRPALHFSHANGFPASSYATFLAPLEREYRVGATAAIGTSTAYPVTERWVHLVEELIAVIERDYEGEPVIGLGHSLGGYLSFLAAARRPELFRAIVLLDAPIIGAIKGRLLGATKRFGIVDRVTPAGATRDRRSRWESREEARAHFRTRRLFRHFSDASLDDYVSGGLVEDVEGRLRLRIDPLVEYRIYRTIPHDMSRSLRALSVPAGFIGGAHSNVVRRTGLAATRSKFVTRKVSGGHLFPLEHPQEAAQAVLEMIRTLE